MYHLNGCNLDLAIKHNFNLMFIHSFDLFKAYKSYLEIGSVRVCFWQWRKKNSDITLKDNRQYMFIFT